MPRYLDGFVIPIPKRKLPEYLRIAKQCGKVWKEHGALDYVESVGDDLNVKGVSMFPKLVKAKPGETVLFSYIIYKSKAHRDRVNAKVMKDPRIGDIMEGKDMPFDMAKITYGGFKVIVDL